MILLGALLIAGQAQSAPFFDGSVTMTLQPRYGTVARLRGPAVNELFHRLRFAAVGTRLVEVNRFFNRFEYRSGRELGGERDYWPRPVEFIDRRARDSEDLAVTQHFVLRALGVPD